MSICRSVLPGNRLVGSITGYGKDMTFLTDGFDSDNPINSAFIGGVLNDTRSAKLNIQLSGRLNSPEVAINSDLS